MSSISPHVMFLFNHVCRTQREIANETACVIMWRNVVRQLYFYLSDVYLSMSSLWLKKKYWRMHQIIHVVAFGLSNSTSSSTWPVYMYIRFQAIDKWLLSIGPRFEMKFVHVRKMDSSCDNYFVHIMIRLTRGTIVFVNVNKLLTWHIATFYYSTLRKVWHVLSRD